MYFALAGRAGDRLHMTMAVSFQGSPAGSPGSRRGLWWLLGIAAAAALLVILYPVLVPIGILLNMSSRADDVEKAQLQRDRQQAIHAQERLRAAAVDGQLTDSEIAKVVGWHSPVDR